MYLGIQPSLVERTVFEVVRRDPKLRPHYERQFADCYEHSDGNHRDQAFARLHERWFNELGLRDLIAERASEFPHFRTQVDRLMVTEAHAPWMQSAELLGSPGQFTVVIAVAASTLPDRAAFQYLARHEFLHIDDMLDPAFGYDAENRPCGPNVAARNLMQDRYAILWAISVDARLTERRMAPADVREKRQAELIRAFARHDAEKAACAFQECWEQWRCLVPNHLMLLEWAQQGLPGLHATDLKPKDEGAKPPGAPCPLCGFPTFDWASRSAPVHLEDVIRADFPDWTPCQSICGRCVEIYGARAGAQTILVKG